MYYTLIISLFIPSTQSACYARARLKSCEELFVVTKYLVKTDHGDVVVHINETCENALDNDLLSLEAPTTENTQDITFEVPLRAFGAKMLEIIDMVGTGSFNASATMLDMMKKEKATSDLNKIERWAKTHYQTA